MAKFSGELPVELVSQIRKFSKPVFTYFREYNSALRALNKTEWVELREKLTGEDGEKVCAILNVFLRSHRVHTEAEERFAAFQRSIGENPDLAEWDHETNSIRGPILTEEMIRRKERWINAVSIAQQQLYQCQRALMVKVYGEALVEWSEMMLRRADRFGYDEDAPF
jgi:hypothetical protein